MSVGRDYLTVRGEPSAIFDRVSLYKTYGSEAGISTNVLRIPRQFLDHDWLRAVNDILGNMTALRESLKTRQATPA